MMMIMMMPDDVDDDDDDDDDEELCRLPSKRCTRTDPCWHLRHSLA